MRGKAGMEPKSSPRFARQGRGAYGTPIFPRSMPVLTVGGWNPRATRRPVRHIILHHHIFKNAGSTLDFALRRQFGADLGEVHNMNGGIVDGRMLREYVDGRPNLRAITSHHFHCQDFAASVEGRRYRFIHLALVRKPIARLVSIYKFY